MADGPDAANARKSDNSRVLSALVTGAFGLIGTIATVFAVRQDVPSPAPTAASLGQPSASLVHTPVMAQPAPPDSRPTPASAPNLLLNFAAFQARLATHEVGSDERQQITRPLLGHTVIWKGYVDALTPMSSPTTEAAITVSLVESRDKISQSMFKTPAFFRFGPEQVDAIARLVPGDEVTLTGTLADHSLVGTNVTGAHVMTINGLPAARTIAAPETATPR